jgi:acetylornithine deacetylase
VGGRSLGYHYGRFGEVIDEQAVTNLARELVQVGTVTGHEDNLAPMLGSHLEASGLEVRVVPFAGGRTNVYGCLRGEGAGPATLLAGHVDTVGPRNWAARWGDDERADAWAGVVRDGSLWGLGAADDKGGIAPMLCALRALHELGVRPPGDIVVALVGDEESGEPGMGVSAGTRALCAEVTSGALPRPDFAVYAEPTRLDVYAAQPGFFIASVALIGKGCYFAYPWEGNDAIRRAHDLLARLYDYEAALRARELHPTIGRPVLVVTEVRGGESVAVPERCDLSLIRTVLPPSTLAEARDELEELVRRFSIDHGVKCELRFTAPRDSPIGGTAAETGPGHPAVQLLVKCSAIESTGATVGAAPYWSELPLLATLGTPGVYFGPGDISVCHTPFEHVPVTELARAARSLATFLSQSWAGQALTTDRERAGEP